MEITLFQNDEPLTFERIVIYPYPDLKRLWVRMWLTAHEEKQPNVDLRVFNPDGTENNSVCLLSQSEQRIETTLHLRDPEPGGIYHVIAELTLGFGKTPELVERREFDMMLVFRNPDAKEPGFGIGVDWDSLE